MKVLLLIFFPLFVWAAEAQLKPIDKSKVCMQLDEAYPTKQRSVKIGKHNYNYCCDRCKSKLLENPELRIAKDPFSGKEINKALAYTAQDSLGNVVYFENEKNFKTYVEKGAQDSSAGLAP